MVVGVSVFELHVPGSRGLKEKRKVVKSLIDRIHKRFRVSVAETGHHDLHQRAEISVAVIGQDYADGERLLDALRELVESEPQAMLTSWDAQVLEGVG